MEQTNLSDNAAHRRFVCQPVTAVRASTTLERDVIEGLLKPPRSLPPKYFYDAHGSRLFEQICTTPEYYPSRTEDALLQAHAHEILATTAPASILEFGSGSSRKMHHLLQAAARHGFETDYWPFDICESMVREAGMGLVQTYPWLRVQGLVGDYLGGLDHLPKPDDGCLFVFLGGTIGNFEPDQAHKFLSEVRSLAGPSDYFLLGADRVKDPDVLRAAYSDSAGITAAFNLNVLDVLNEELGSDFRSGAFEHRAEYNEELHQIEMYLVSRTDQIVSLGSLDRSINLSAGERILTEISRKFTPARLDEMLQSAGFTVERQFEPNDGYFSLILARPA